MSNVNADNALKSTGVGTPVAFARKHSVYILIAAALLISSILKPQFLSLNHMLNLLRQTAPLAVVAAGQTVTIIAGSFDLSVGSVIGLTNVILADSAFAGNLGGVLGIALVLLLGAGVGCINGLGIVKLSISPLIMTMGMLITLEGITLLVSGGAPGGTIAPLIKFLGSGKTLNIPLAFIFWMAVTLVLFIVLKKTHLGRMIYAAGGNKNAAFMSGVTTDRVVITSHIFCGITAACAGVMLSGYIGTGALGLGKDYMMNSIAAVIIGGARLEGGSGGVTGSAAGSFLLVVIISIFSMFNLGYPAKLILAGGVIIAAMAMQKGKRQDR